MQFPLNLAGSDPMFIFRIDQSMILPLAGIAVAGLSIHYCLTNAFRYGDAMIVIPMDFLRVPLVAVIGWLPYGEPLDAFVFAGAALIIVGVLWNVRGEAQHILRRRLHGVRTHDCFASAGAVIRATMRSAMERHEKSLMSRVSGRASLRRARACASISSSVS